MIDDLRLDVPTYKYVDDTTLYTVSNDPNDDRLQTAVTAVKEWSSNNDMRLNSKKTKEMVISFSKPPPQLPSIKVDGCPLERVDSVTLLGVILSSDLSWDMHMGHILKKAQSRLFALNILRRAKVSGEDIMQIFSSKIRPVLEYASPV